MDNDDVLRVEDVATVRASVLKERRKVLAAALATPPIAAIVAWVVMYYFNSNDAVVATFTSAVFLLIGIPTFLHWLRHYRSILGQLDQVAQRVRSGETVYGSKVVFNSHR